MAFLCFSEFGAHTFFANCKKRHAVCFYNVKFVKVHQRLASSRFAKFRLWRQRWAVSVQFGRIKVICSPDGLLATNTIGDYFTTLFTSVAPYG